MIITVSFAYTAVTMDTSAAQSALSQIETQRVVTSNLVESVIQVIGRKFHLTNNAIHAIQESARLTIEEINKDIQAVQPKLEKAKEETKKSTRWMIMHVYQFVNQTWNLIEMAFGLGKNTAAKMVGFAVQAMTSVISAGYAAAAQYAAMGPWGILLATPTLIMTGVTVAQQASVIAQQAGLESQTMPAIDSMFSTWVNGG